MTQIQQKTATPKMVNYTLVKEDQDSVDTLIPFYI